MSGTESARGDSATIISLTLESTYGWRLCLLIPHCPAWKTHGCLDSPRSFSLPCLQKVIATSQVSLKFCFNSLFKHAIAFRMKFSFFSKWYQAVLQLCPMYCMQLHFLLLLDHLLVICLVMPCAFRCYSTTLHWHSSHAKIPVLQIPKGSGYPWLQYAIKSTATQCQAHRWMNEHRLLEDMWTTHIDYHSLSLVTGSWATN